MDAVCYGFKQFGQIGAETSQTVLSQFHLDGLAKSIKCLAFGWSRSYLVFESGTVYLQGFFESNSYNRKKLELPFQEVVKKVTCSRLYDLFLTENGSCWKFTVNNSQWVKLDYLIAEKLKNCPFKIDDIASSDETHLAWSDEGFLFTFPVSIDLPVAKKVLKACCGFEHYVCLLENGSVCTWGSGSRGQLGNGSLNAVEQPEILIPLDGLVVTDVDAGGWHSAAVTISGDLYTWGWNNVGQLGLHSEENPAGNCDEPVISVISEPQIVSCLDDFEASFKQVACGNNHTIVLLDDGTVWGCGSNKYGQLNPTSSEKIFHQMTQVPLPEKTDSVKSLYCASWNSVIYITCKE